MDVINIMSQQNKSATSYPSLIASLYSAWQQHQIPAIFYHYTLSILSAKEKKDQIALMHKQLKLLKAGNHIYHTIFDNLQARERSLQIIKHNVSILTQPQNAVHLNWSNAHQQVEAQGFNLIYESKGVQNKQNRTLIQLINHIKMYQKLTYQVTISINNWQVELTKEGYSGPIQFLYKHTDYLQKMLTDTKEITSNYQLLFQNNPFLIFKREHQSNQFSLIYRKLKISPDFANKINEALQILSNHDTSIEHYRIIGRYKQFGSRKKVMKSQSLHKIYCNYNNGNDYLIVKDPFLKSDTLTIDPKNNFKFLGNNNILINPEVHPPRYSERRHPVYLQDSLLKTQKTTKSQMDNLPRSSSLKNIQIKKINQRQSLVVSTKLDPTENYGKIMHKKLSLYDNLDRQIKYSQAKKLQAATSASPQSEAQKIRISTPQTITQEQAVQSEVVFKYQTNIQPYNIIKYLRTQVFSNLEMELKDIQIIAKNIISQKQYVTLVSLTSAGKIVAWMAIKFLTKELSIRKAVQIIYSYKFVKIPNFEHILINEFLGKGYGVIRQNGKIMHQIQISQKISEQAIKIKYRVSGNVDVSSIKDVIKKNQCLKQSRILKYYYYSKQSKYHRYCQHSNNTCQIGYQFQQIFKITISNQPYLRFKCDKITKVGNCYRIFHHLNNTDLLIGHQIQDILQFANHSSIQFNSSFEQHQGKSVDFDYLCLPQTKIIHKYLQLTEKPLIVQYITASVDIPQILSISIDKKSVKNYLIMEKPFLIGIICKNEEDFGKTLAILVYD